jgi:chromosome segregation ATPase
MNEETKKPVTGSNEHHAEIESRLRNLEGTLSTASTLISSLQSSVSSLTTNVDSLKRQIERSQPLTSQVLGTVG